MTNTKDRVSYAASSARPYVERALRDKELRDNIRNAYTSARAVYEELSSRKRVSDAASSNCPVFTTQRIRCWISVFATEALTL